MNEGALTNEDKLRLRWDKEDCAAVLRIEGMGYKQIARELHYCDASGARKAVKRSLARHPSDEVEERRQIMAARIDRLIGVLWPEAMKGKLFSIDRIISLMHREADLFGLDGAKTVNVKEELYTIARREADKYGLSEAEALAIAEEVLKDHRRRG